MKVVDNDDTFDGQMADYLRTFTQKIRDYRKAEQAEMEYDIRLEFRHQRPHAHLTIITNVNLSRNTIKELVKGWWATSCSGRPTTVYCDRVHTVIGHANYVTKNVMDRSRVEMPPQEWNGRRCRLVWRSRGFLTKTKELLWQEQRAEWYPQPVAAGVLYGEEDALEGRQTSEKMPTSPTVARWPGKWLVVLSAICGPLLRFLLPPDGPFNRSTVSGPCR